MKPLPPLNPEKAMEYALRLLGQRSYSTQTLQRKLAMRQVGPDDQAKIIQRLTDWGLLDDAAYAATMIRTESNYRHSSTWRIKQRLKQKGVADTVIEEGFTATESEVNQEVERAVYHATRFVQSHTKLAGFERKQKAAAYLYRKGFPSTVIREALGRVL